MSSGRMDRFATLYDRLLELFFLREEAEAAGDLEKVRAVQGEIDRAEIARQALRASAMVGATAENALMKTSGATQRRHVREKSVIEHIARELYQPKPEPATEKSTGPSSTTETGLPVEEQVRKEWDPKKGGLPIF